MVWFNTYPPPSYPLKEINWLKPLIYLKTTLYISNAPLLCAELHPSLVAARSHTSDKPAPGLANRWFLAQTLETSSIRFKDPPPPRSLLFANSPPRGSELHLQFSLKTEAKSFTEQCCHSALHCTNSVADLRSSLSQTSPDIVLIAAPVKLIYLIRWSKPRLNTVFVHVVIHA